MYTYEPMFDDDGELLCYESGAPLNGETTAGREGAMPKPLAHRPERR